MFSLNFVAQFQGNIPRSLTRRSRLTAIGCTLAIIAMTIQAPMPAQASWCAMYHSGGTNCGFSSHAQCMASVSGAGGFCNQILDSAPAARPERPQRTISEPKRKPEPKNTQAAPRQSAATPAAAAPIVAPVRASPGSTPAAAPAPAAAQADSAFAQARQLILGGQFDAGLAAMRALNFDDHPDVATYIGFAHRKLGRVDEAKSWYERALAADPNHKLALSFSGMLRADQGDIPGAQADLVRIGRLCGNTNCNEYQALQGVIAVRLR